MVWIDVDMGESKQCPGEILIVCGEAVDGRKMEDPSPFLMGGRPSRGPWGGHTPLYFML